MKDTMTTTIPIWYRGYHVANVDFKKPLNANISKPVHPEEQTLVFTRIPSKRYEDAYCGRLIYAYVAVYFFKTYITDHKINDFVTTAHFDEDYAANMKRYITFRDLMVAHNYDNIDPRLVIRKDGLPWAYAVPWTSSAYFPNIESKSEREIFDSYITRYDISDEVTGTVHSFAILPATDIQMWHSIFMLGNGNDIRLRSAYSVYKDVQNMLAEIETKNTYPEGFTWGIHDYCIENMHP